MRIPAYYVCCTRCVYSVRRSCSVALFIGVLPPTLHESLLEIEYPLRQEIAALLQLKEKIDASKTQQGAAHGAARDLG